MKAVKMIVVRYLQGFTSGYTIKEINIFLSSDKKTIEHSRLIRILAISCILALNCDAVAQKVL